MTNAQWFDVADATDQQNLSIGASQSIAGDSQAAAATALTAQQIFAAAGGKASFLSEMAMAAYHLDPTEVVAAGVNAASTTAEDAAFTDVASRLRMLTSADLPSLALVNSGDANFPKTGLTGNGIFLDGNAAAIVGVASDALFISFRGTNDLTTLGLLSALASDGGTPDVHDWYHESTYYALFQSFIAAIQSYVTANGIAHVYVTGHSLGAAMAEEFMAQNADTATTHYEAMTFGDIGYSGDTASDTRLVNILIDGEAANILNGNGVHTIAADPFTHNYPVVGPEYIIQNSIAWKFNAALWISTLHEDTLQAAVAKYFDQHGGLPPSGSYGRDNVHINIGLDLTYISDVSWTVSASTSGLTENGTVADDVFIGDSNSNAIDGAGGFDIVDYAAFATSVVAYVHGGAGHVNKNAGNATDAVASIDEIIGSTVNDVFYVDAAMIVQGGGGFDIVVETSNAVVAVGIGKTLVQVQEVIAAGGVNVLDGSTTSDFIYLYGGGAGSTNTMKLGAGGGYEISTGGTNHMFGGGSASATDIFIGGIGTADMHGGAGANVYYVGANDTVAGAGTFNTLVELATGVHLSLGSSHVQLVVLNGGTNVLDMTGSTDFVTLYGGAGTNTMTLGVGGGYELSTGGTNHMFGGASGSGTDVFVGIAGTSDMHGGTGANVYYVGAHDTVAGAGLYNTMIETVSGVTLTLGSSGLTNVQQFILAGGNNTVDATSASYQVFFYGGAGNDTLKGGTGNDYYFAATGANTFVMGANWGQDHIQDWAAGSGDVIDFHATGITTFGQLSQTITAGDDIITSSLTGANQIVLTGVTTPLTASSFMFA